MTASAREILVMGLPKAGKTTFIAALWHVISTKEISSELQMAELQPSRDHLNAIAKRWRECVAVERTIHGKDRKVSLNLQTTDGSKVFRLTLPDTSGEVFTRIFENRRWTASFGETVDSSDALIFFLHPDSLVVPQRIDDGVEEAVHVMEIVEPSGQETSPQKTSNLVPWETSRASAQAKILDLLQLVIRARKSRALRIVIIVSAWDLLKHKRISPDKWLAEKAPLVWQFLNANKEKRPYIVYGISAQGDDYSKANTLREFIKPSERIRVVSEQESSSDITKPLVWALE
jgi:hypothetical protein